MTPIQQLIRVAQRNTEREMGMWIYQNLQTLSEREKNSYLKLWEMCLRGKTFTEAYEILMKEEYENEDKKSMDV